MLIDSLNLPWEQIPFCFQYPYHMVWFLGPEGYIDGYMLDYGSFTLVYTDKCQIKNPSVGFKYPLLTGH